MPSGVPVATVAIDGAANAGILALQILATADESLYHKLEEYKESLKEKVNTARLE
jgi:5-(carboxyamino)imidazole ribonucleotide mutase